MSKVQNYNDFLFEQLFKKDFPNIDESFLNLFKTNKTDIQYDSLSDIEASKLEKNGYKKVIQNQNKITMLFQLSINDMVEIFKSTDNLYRVKHYYVDRGNVNVKYLLPKDNETSYFKKGGMLWNDAFIVVQDAYEYI